LERSRLKRSRLKCSRIHDCGVLVVNTAENRTLETQNTEKRRGGAGCRGKIYCSDTMLKLREKTCLEIYSGGRVE
jgi:hypothetical protein